MCPKVRKGRVDEEPDTLTTRFVLEDDAAVLVNRQVLQAEN